MCSMILLLENLSTFILLLFIPNIHPSIYPFPLLFCLFFLKSFTGKIWKYKVEKAATEFLCAHHPAPTLVTIPLLSHLPQPHTLCFCPEYIKTNLRKCDFALKYFSMNQFLKSISIMLLYLMKFIVILEYCLILS